MEAARWKKPFLFVLRPLRDLVLAVFAPMTESREFKVLYPLLVVSLGLLAAFRADQIRTVIVVFTFLLIAVVSAVTIFLDSRKLRLECRWNLLFFSYYRPFLITLSNKIARSADDDHKLDILTYRTDDFLTALDEAAADFEQVSGESAVNIASFDIEFVSVLTSGVNQTTRSYHLIPLSDFWTGRGLYDFPSRMPSEIRRSVLQRLSPEHLYALPIGWGLVGVSIIEKDLTGRDIVDLLTTKTTQGKRGFEFELLFENIEHVRELGYEVFCYDFWSSIGQLVALNYTGHMTVTPAQETMIESVFQRIRVALPASDIIGNPILLLNKVRAAAKSVVIGGSSWFGIKGTLLPISIPAAKPTYGAFCECLGLLARPQAEQEADWESDARKLISWLANELGDQRSYRGAALSRGSILRHYLPGLVRDGVLGDLWAEQAMQIDQDAGIVFRQFSVGDIDSIRRMRELWEGSGRG